MSVYDEIELEDLTYDTTLERYTYPCPCGDQFEISLADMRDGESIAVCPSCSLTIRVVFEIVSFFFFFFRLRAQRFELGWIVVYVGRDQGDGESKWLMSAAL